MSKVNDFFQLTLDDLFKYAENATNKRIGILYPMEQEHEILMRLSEFQGHHIEILFCAYSECNKPVPIEFLRHFLKHHQLYARMYSIAACQKYHPLPRDMLEQIKEINSNTSYDTERSLTREVLEHFRFA